MLSGFSVIFLVILALQNKAKASEECFSFCSQNGSDGSSGGGMHWKMTQDADCMKDGDGRSMICRTRACFKGNSNDVVGNRANVTGDFNIVTGSRAMVTGNSNSVYGSRAKVDGDYNLVFGSRAVVNGNSNNVHGNRTKVIRDNNTVFGSRVVANGNSNVFGSRVNVTGDYNTVYGIKAQVNGKRNRICAEGVTVEGEDNLVIINKGQNTKIKIIPDGKPIICRFEDFDALKDQLQSI